MYDLRGRTNTDHPNIIITLTQQQHRRTDKSTYHSSQRGTKIKSPSQVSKERDTVQCRECCFCAYDSSKFFAPQERNSHEENEKRPGNSNREQQVVTRQAQELKQVVFIPRLGKSGAMRLLVSSSQHSTFSFCLPKNVTSEGPLALFARDGGNEREHQ